MHFRLLCLLLMASVFAHCHLFKRDAFPHNSYGEQASSDTPEVAATHAPKIITKPMFISVKDGNSVALPCDVTDLEPYVIIWKRGDKQVLYAAEQKITRESRIRKVNTTLHIDGAQETDAGQYICQVTTNPPDEIAHNLTVFVPPHITTNPQSGNLVVKKGDSITLECKAEGTPKPSLKWRKINGSLYDSEGQEEMERSGNSLIILQADRRDSGFYECVATNNIGIEADQSFRVTVLSSPAIEIKERTVYGAIGDTVTLSCEVHSEPESNVIWTKEGDLKQITQSDKYKYHKNGTSAILQVTLVSQDDYDNYSCVADNAMGVATSPPIEISGVPLRAIFTSEQFLQTEETSYELLWAITSFTPIDKYRLRIRKVNMDADIVEAEEWKDIEFSPPESEPEDNTYKHNYSIQDLDIGERYEVLLMARNMQGWSKATEFDFTLLKPSEASVETDNGLHPSLSALLATLAIMTLMLTAKIN